MQQKAARNDKNVDTYTAVQEKKNLNVIFISLLIITFIDFKNVRYKPTRELQEIINQSCNKKLNYVSTEKAGILITDALAKQRV